MLTARRNLRRMVTVVPPGPGEMLSRIGGLSSITARHHRRRWGRLRGGAPAFRVDRILAAADTGEPAALRSYRDLDVDIPDEMVRRPDLQG